MDNNKIMFQEKQHAFAHAEGFEREVLDKSIDKISPLSEMSMNERYFLNGIIRHIKPKKLLEAGVSAGGSSAIILNAIDDIDNAKLYSVDYSTFYLGDAAKKIGFVVPDSFPQYLGKWQLFAGGDVSKYIEQIGGEIDFALIDTAHVHPVETLNFLCVLPFMKIGSWVILHDISIQWLSKHSLACRYLFDHVVSENKLSPEPDAFPMFANIGAFQITNSTIEHLRDVFMSLTIPWGIWDDNWSKCEDFVDFNDVSKIIKRYYDENYYKIFEDAVEFQIEMHKSWKNDRKLATRIKEYLKTNNSGLYHRMKTSKFWRGLKRTLRL